MGLAHTHKFGRRENQISNACKALAHPARIAIIEMLTRCDRCFCGELVNEIPLSQATISQHLRALKDAGLIKGDIEGTSVCYHVDPVGWQRLKSFISSFLAQPCC